MCRHARPCTPCLLAIALASALRQRQGATRPRFAVTRPAAPRLPAAPALVPAEVQQERSAPQLGLGLRGPSDARADREG